MTNGDEFRAKQEPLPLEGMPAISPLRHAAESDNPWAQKAYRTYLLVRNAHQAPRVDRRERLAAIGAAFDAWVERNSSAGRYFDPDDPTPEEESELFEMQLEADPTVMSEEWALENVTMTKTQLRQLLRSGMYGAMSDSDIDAFLARPEHSWRLEGNE